MSCHGSILSLSSSSAPFSFSISFWGCWAGKRLCWCCVSVCVLFVMWLHRTKTFRCDKWPCNKTPWIRHLKHNFWLVFQYPVKRVEWNRNNLWMLNYCLSWPIILVQSSGTPQKLNTNSKMVIIGVSQWWSTSKSSIWFTFVYSRGKMNWRSLNWAKSAARSFLFHSISPLSQAWEKHTHEKQWRILCLPVTFMSVDLKGPHLIRAPLWWTDGQSSLHVCSAYMSI